MSAGEGSVFPPIEKDHPLAEAARIVNAYAEERGLPATLEWLGMNVDAGRLAYLGEQRALRATAAATLEHNMGLNPGLDNAIVGELVRTPLWRDMRMLLIGCYMDGFAIGWKGRELSMPDDEREAIRTAVDVLEADAEATEHGGDARDWLAAAETLRRRIAY